MNKLISSVVSFVKKYWWLVVLILVVILGVIFLNKIVGLGIIVSTGIAKMIGISKEVKKPNKDELEENVNLKNKELEELQRKLTEELSRQASLKKEHEQKVEAIRNNSNSPQYTTKDSSNKIADDLQKRIKSILKS